MPALAGLTTFAPSTTILSAVMNNNFIAVQTAVNNVDNSQVGPLGFYASQLIPTNGTQATFGGAQGYAFANGLSVGTTLTVGSTLGVTGAATFSSSVVAVSFQATSSVAITAQGSYIQWSRIGNGAMYVINQKGTGAGGIIFGHSTAGNAFTQDAVLAEGGGLTLAGGLIAAGGLTTAGAIAFNSGSAATISNSYSYISITGNNASVGVQISNTTSAVIAEFLVGAALQSYINGVGVYTTVSDERHKKDIRTLTNGIETISALNPVSFAWKSSGAKDIGFIAQQVEPIIPEAVSIARCGTEAEQYMLSDRQIIAYLVRAVQEQQTIIHDLSVKVDFLTSVVQSHVGPDA